MYYSLFIDISFKFIYNKYIYLKLKKENGKTIIGNNSIDLAISLNYPIGIWLD